MNHSWGGLDTTEGADTTCTFHCILLYIFYVVMIIFKMFYNFDKQNEPQ